MAISKWSEIRGLCSFSIPGWGQCSKEVSGNIPNNSPTANNFPLIKQEWIKWAFPTFYFNLFFLGGTILGSGKPKVHSVFSLKYQNCTLKPFECEHLNICSIGREETVTPLQIKEKIYKIKTRKKAYLPYHSNKSYKQMFTAIFELTETRLEQDHKHASEMSSRRERLVHLYPPHSVQHVAEPTAGT